MTTIVQVNLRAPEGDKAVLADVAARLREGGGFAERLSAFLAADGAGAAWSSRLAEIERRLAALEAEWRKDAYEALHPEVRATRDGGGGRNNETRRQLGDDIADCFTADTAARTGQSERKVQRDAERGERVADIEDLPSPVPDDPVEPAGAAVTAWTTGSGKGTKLTDAGQREVLRLHGEAVSNAEIGRRVGVSGTSVANFLKRYDGALEEPLSG